jgi:toxin ParE1/3/4
VSLFRLTRRAEADLLSIADYTFRIWGRTQESRYMAEIEDCCASLADNPALGRLCDDIRPGLRRFEHGEHVVFYRREHRGVVISRILHRRMLPERHSFNDPN